MADNEIPNSSDASAARYAAAGAYDDTEPAVQTPVLRTTRQVVHAEHIQFPVVAVAEHCASKLDAVAITLLSSGNPVVRVLGALKAGFDVGECAVDELNHAQTAADHRAAIDQCLAHEGTPLGFLDDTLTCAVPPGNAPPSKP